MRTISQVEIQHGRDPVSWRDDTSPLILVREGRIASASRKTDKRELVREAMQSKDATLLFAWVGQWSTDVFVVDDYERALDGLASPTGAVR